MDRIDDLPDMNLNGVGQAAGGEYRNVRTDGVCQVATDVKAETFVANGILKVAGSLAAKRFESNGKITVNGKMQAEQAKIDGMLRVRGSVAGEQFVMNGLLTADGDFEAEKLNLQGGFTIQGLLNAGTIDIRLQGRGEARELGGESIRVVAASRRVWSKLLQWAIPQLTVRLEADVIEGDDIELEETTANVVRGGNVRIGKGCRIGRVEYRGELKVHPQAKVNERIPG